MRENATEASRDTEVKRVMGCAGPVIIQKRTSKNLTLDFMPSVQSVAEYKWR